MVEGGDGEGEESVAGVRITVAVGAGVIGMAVGVCMEAVAIVAVVDGVGVGVCFITPISHVPLLVVVGTGAYTGGAE